MNCNCKICRNNLTQTVNAWCVDGLSLIKIVEKLQTENGLNVTSKTLQRHFEKFELEIKTENNNFKLIEGESKSSKSLEYDLNNISFSRYNFDETNPLDAITYLQKVHLHLYFRQLEIVCKEQELYYKGETEELPHGSLIRLKMLYELLNNITGISLYANQQAAIQKIESMGLKVERFSTLITSHENAISNTSYSETTEKN